MGSIPVLNKKQTNKEIRCWEKLKSFDLSEGEKEGRLVGSVLVWQAT